MLNLNRNSLGSRIFTSMFLLVVIAFALVSGITYYQYREQIRDYNKDRLERKENSIKKDIDRTLKTTTYQLITEKIEYIFKDEIFEIASIHGENVTLYDLKGKPLISSTEKLFNSEPIKPIPLGLLDTLNTTESKRYVKSIKSDPPQQLSYSFVNDPKFKPLAILKIQYQDTDSFINKEMRELLWRMVVVALLVFISAIILAFLLSRYCLLYTSPSPRDGLLSRMPSSA